MIENKKIIIGTDKEDESNVYLELTITEKDLTKQRIYDKDGILIRVGNTKETVDHKQVSKYTVLSISGCGRGYGGQIQDMLTEKHIKFNSIYDVKRIVEIWNEWHLNDLQAGCIHMEKPAEGKEQDTKEWSRLNKMCPKGYRYGSKWLVKIIPEEIITEIIELFDK